jgi:lipid II:glycine glycyltransferase (peptidoglycan interpeptide bridge formation enzyme)
MIAVFKYKLDNAEIESIKEYCNSVDYCSAEQFIGWTEIFYKSKICYFYLSGESGIRSFCQINERLKSAQILLGPVCCDKEVMVASIDEIISHYKKKGYYYLGVQMYYKSGFDTEYIEYYLSRKHSIKYIYDRENTLSSMEINLGRSIEEIFSSFGRNHKREIIKGQKAGVIIDSVKNRTDAELEAFMEIYSRMCKIRKLSGDSFATADIHEIFDYLKTNKKGQILFLKDKEGIMLGGIIMVYQGVAVRLLKGPTDPERRDIPIFHMLIYEIIKMSKEANFRYLDLWGYNHFVDEKDQVYNINKFKKGFGGYYTFLAKKMNISLVPGGYYIYKSLLWLKKILLRIHFLKISRSIEIHTDN